MRICLKNVLAPLAACVVSSVDGHNHVRTTYYELKTVHVEALVSCYAATTGSECTLAVTPMASALYEYPRLSATKAARLAAASTARNA